MKLMLILLLTLSIILESTFLPVPLTLSSFMLVIMIFPESSPFWALWVGVVLDLFTGRLLGSDSLFFLAVIFLSGRYQTKMFQKQLLFHLPFFLLVVLIYLLLFYRNLDWTKLTVLLILSLLYLFALRKLLPEKEKNKLSI